MASGGVDAPERCFQSERARETRAVWRSSEKKRLAPHQLIRRSMSKEGVGSKV